MKTCRRPDFRAFGSRFYKLRCEENKAQPHQVHYAKTPTMGFQGLFIPANIKAAGTGLPCNDDPWQKENGEKANEQCSQAYNEITMLPLSWTNQQVSEIQQRLPEYWQQLRDKCPFLVTY